MRIFPILNTNYYSRINFGVKEPEALGCFSTRDQGSVPKDVDTFTMTEKTSDKYQIRDLTDNEFKEMKAKIVSRKEYFKAFRLMDTELINKMNVQLLDYMLQHPDVYDNEDYVPLVSNMTDKYGYWPLIRDKNQTEVALRMLKMPWFIGIDEWTRESAVSYVAYSVPEGNDAVKDIKLKMLDKLDEHKEITKFSGPVERVIVDMLSGINTKDGLKVALKLLDNPEILDIHNQGYYTGFSKDCFKGYSNKKNYANIKLALIREIEKNQDELFSTPYFKHSTVGLFNNVVDPQTRTFALKVLDNPDLFKSKSFAKNLGNIMYHYPTGKHDTSVAERKVMNDILDAIIARPELFENEDFLNDLGQLIFIQKDHYYTGGYVIFGGDKPGKIGKRNLFLIENGFYNTSKAEK